MATTKRALNPNAKKWVMALRSGKYRQAKSTLCRLDSKGRPLGYCCLGVACELAVKDGVRLDVTNNTASNRRQYDGRDGVLPEKVRKWLGLRSVDGDFTTSQMTDGQSLTIINDKGKKFKTIADIIESRPEGLFRRGK